MVSIKDTGCGIDPEILPRLFSKFVTKSDAGGTGLGLFISKSIVEAHGGRIWAENNQGEAGATFTFSLPASSSSIPLQSPLSTSTLPSQVEFGVRPYCCLYLLFWFCKRFVTLKVINCSYPKSMVH